MAAGGITYDMVLPRRVTTLPSVESWGTNMNILKDPPKSIHTRRIDKVGDTQEITIDIDGAGDRICEMINVYGRGINQMVGVNYGNNGTNGGQNRQTPTVRGELCRLQIVLHKLLSHIKHLIMGLLDLLSKDKKIYYHYLECQESGRMQ